MGADVFIDSRAAADHVRAALRGPVIRILAEGIPEINHMSHVAAYERLLGDISLLERSFAYFRANRQRFAAVLVDGEQRPVSDDSALLSCGRTLNEVIAMILRSAANRQFKRRLGDRRVMPPPGAAPAAGGILASLLGPMAGGRKRSVAQRPLRSRAQELYLAIREYLLYEWQVALVPTYSELTPREVATLGPRLVDLKSAEAIMVATGRPRLKIIPGTRPAPAPLSGSAAREGAAVPSARPDLGSLLTDDGRRLRVEALAGALREAEVVRVGDNGEQPAHVKVALKAVGSDLLRALVEDLGLDKRRLAVCLVRAQAVMPPSAFEQWVRSPAASVALARLVGAARQAGIGPKSTLADCAGLITRLYAPVPAPA